MPIASGHEQSGQPTPGLPSISAESVGAPDQIATARADRATTPSRDARARAHVKQRPLQVFSFARSDSFMSSLKLPGSRE